MPSLEVVNFDRWIEEFAQTWFIYSFTAGGRTQENNSGRYINFKTQGRQDKSQSYGACKLTHSKVEAFDVKGNFIEFEKCS